MTLNDTAHALDAVCSPGTTRVLAAFAAAAPGVRAPNAAHVTHALIDTIGVSIAARDVDGEPFVRAWARPQESMGTSTVWTTGETTSASVAALLNGNASHVLDYDDVSPSMPMHPSAVLMPALLAVAEDRKVSAERFIDAYGLGAAAFRAVAEVLPHQAHYGRGWHTTSTVGRLATVAALVRLVAADEQTARRALGIASSLASGARSNFGSMTKPLHAGVAARDAVMALELAEQGFTANEDELEAAGGFLERFGDEVLAPPGDTADTVSERLEYWYPSWPNDWGIKVYPSCYGTHRALDAALSIRARLGTRKVVSADVHVHPRGIDPLRSAMATTHLEAKFSLEYTLALALQQGTVGLADFTAEAFAASEAPALAARVTLTEVDEPGTGPAAYPDGFAIVHVHLDDGTTEVERVDVTSGDGRHPINTEGLLGKFLDCGRVAGMNSRAARTLFDALLALPEADGFEAITAALRTRGEVAE